MTNHSCKNESTHRQCFHQQKENFCQKKLFSNNMGNQLVRKTANSIQSYEENKTIGIFS